MKRTQTAALLASVSLFIPSLALLSAQPAYADRYDNDARLQRRLEDFFGLNTVQCGSRGREISVYDQDDNRACARATDEYPPGVYFFDRQNGELRAAGGNRPAASNSNPGNAATPPSNPQPMSGYTGAPTPGTVLQPGGFVYPNGVQGSIPAQVTGPSILVNNNPAQQVDPGIGAQIAASLQNRGLALAACSANPGVVVLIGSYTACAYPTPTYPAGRYALTLY